MPYPIPSKSFAFWGRRPSGVPQKTKYRAAAHVLRRNGYYDEPKLRQAIAPDIGFSTIKSGFFGFGLIHSVRIEDVSQALSHQALQSSAANITALRAEVDAGENVKSNIEQLATIALRDPGRHEATSAYRALFGIYRNGKKEARETIDEEMTPRLPWLGFRLSTTTWIASLLITGFRVRRNFRRLLMVGLGALAGWGVPAASAYGLKQAHSSYKASAPERNYNHALKQLYSGDAQDRKEAVAELAKMSTEWKRKAFPSLEEALKKEKNPLVKSAIEEIMFADIRERLASAKTDERKAAALDLARLDKKWRRQAFPVLLAALKKEPDAETKAVLEKATFADVLERFTSAASAERKAAIEDLAKMGKEWKRGFFPLLTEALEKNKDHKIRLALLSAISEIRENDFPFICEGFIKKGNIDRLIKEATLRKNAHPKDPEAHYYLGKAYHLNKDLKEAEKAYREAIAIRSSHAKALNNLGLLCENDGRTAEAVGLFQAAIKADPGLAHPHYNLGNIFWQQGKRKEAQQQYMLARNRMMDNPEIQMSLAVTYYSQGEIEMAEALYEEARQELEKLGARPPKDISEYIEFLASPPQVEFSKTQDTITDKGVKIKKRPPRKTGRGNSTGQGLTSAVVAGPMMAAAPPVRHKIKRPHGPQGHTEASIPKDQAEAAPPNPLPPIPIEGSIEPSHRAAPAPNK